MSRYSYDWQGEILFYASITSLLCVVRTLPALVWHSFALLISYRWVAMLSYPFWCCCRSGVRVMSSAIWATPSRRRQGKKLHEAQEKSITYTFVQVTLQHVRMRCLFPDSCPAVRKMGCTSRRTFCGCIERNRGELYMVAEVFQTEPELRCKE